MNLKSFAAVFSLAAMVVSCGRQGQDSSLKEMELKNDDGKAYKVQAFVPNESSKSQLVPAVFIYDCSGFMDQVVWERIDSLYRGGYIVPVVVASIDGSCSSEFFTDTFVPAVQKKWNAGYGGQTSVYFGVDRTADAGIMLGTTQSKFTEYWCYSPMNSDISSCGMLPPSTKYRICYGAKEEIGRFDYYPALFMSIKKRGGQVHSWTYDGGPEPAWWRAWFLDELERSFKKPQ